MSSPGPSSLGSQVHAAAVNGDRSTLLKLLAGKSTRSSQVLPTHNSEGVIGIDRKTLCTPPCRRAGPTGSGICLLRVRPPQGSVLNVQDIV